MVYARTLSNSGTPRRLEAAAAGRTGCNVAAMIRQLCPAILDSRSEAIRRHLATDDPTKQQKAIVRTRGLR